MVKRLDYRAIGGKGLIIPTPLYVDDNLLAECHSACNIDPLSRGIGVQN